MALNCAGKFLDLSQPQVMGILNLSPNSYCATGRHPTIEAALRHAQQLQAEGAAIIDVGAEPTNPGVNPTISLQQELDALIPVIELLTKELSILLSVDTSKPEVMREAIKQGVGFINDVRALQDPATLKIVADAKVAVCLMHMAYPHGKPSNAQSIQEDIIIVIKDFLQTRIEACQAAGIDAKQIVIDPGIGHGNFGKNLAQNLRLINRLHEFNSLGKPILIGISRKTFIGELLNLPVAERLAGSLAATAIAISRGASIIRTHDVKETLEAVRMAEAICGT